MKFSRFIPALIWMIVIFYFSSISTSGVVGTQTQRFLLLKSFHLIEYGLLAVLLYLGFQKYKYSIITAYLYAVSDEIHQYFIAGRTSKFTDTLIDLIGISIGLFIFNRLIRISKNIHKLTH